METLKHILIVALLSSTPAFATVHNFDGRDCEMPNGAEPAEAIFEALKPKVKPQVPELRSSLGGAVISAKSFPQGIQNVTSRVLNYIGNGTNAGRMNVRNALLTQNQLNQPWHDQSISEKIRDVLKDPLNSVDYSSIALRLLKSEDLFGNNAKVYLKKLETGEVEVQEISAQQRAEENRIPTLRERVSECVGSACAIATDVLSAVPNAALQLVQLPYNTSRAQLRAAFDIANSCVGGVCSLIRPVVEGAPSLIYNLGKECVGEACNQARKLFDSSSQSKAKSVNPPDTSPPPSFDPNQREYEIKIPLNYVQVKFTGYGKAGDAHVTLQKKDPTNPKAGAVIRFRVITGQNGEVMKLRSVEGGAYDIWTGKVYGDSSNQKIDVQVDGYSPLNSVFSSAAELPLIKSLPAVVVRGIVDTALEQMNTGFNQTIKTIDIGIGNFLARAINRPQLEKMNHQLSQALSFSKSHAFQDRRSLIKRLIKPSTDNANFWLQSYTDSLLGQMKYLENNPDRYSVKAFQDVYDSHSKSLNQMTQDVSAAFASAEDPQMKKDLRRFVSALAVVNALLYQTSKIASRSYNAQADLKANIEIIGQTLNGGRLNFSAFTQLPTSHSSAQSDAPSENSGRPPVIRVENVQLPAGADMRIYSNVDELNRQLKYLFDLDPGIYEICKSISFLNKTELGCSEVTEFRQLKMKAVEAPKFVWDSAKQKHYLDLKISAQTQKGRLLNFFLPKKLEMKAYFELQPCAKDPQQFCPKIEHRLDKYSSTFSFGTKKIADKFISWILRNHINNKSLPSDDVIALAPSGFSQAPGQFFFDFKMTDYGSRNHAPSQP